MDGTACRWECCLSAVTRAICSAHCESGPSRLSPAASFWGPAPELPCFPVVGFPAVWVARPCCPWPVPPIGPPGDMVPLAYDPRCWLLPASCPWPIRQLVQPWPSAGVSRRGFGAVLVPVIVAPWVGARGAASSFAPQCAGLRHTPAPGSRSGAGGLTAGTGAVDQAGKSRCGWGSGSARAGVRR